MTNGTGTVCRAASSITKTGLATRRQGPTASRSTEPSTIRRPNRPTQWFTPDFVPGHYIAALKDQRYVPGNDAGKRNLHDSLRGNDGRHHGTVQTRLVVKEHSVFGRRGVPIWVVPSLKVERPRGRFTGNGRYFHGPGSKKRGIATEGTSPVQIKATFGTSAGPASA